MLNQNIRIICHPPFPCFNLLSFYFSPILYNTIWFIINFSFQNSMVFVYFPMNIICFIIPFFIFYRCKDLGQLILFLFVAIMNFSPALFNHRLVFTTLLSAFLIHCTYHPCRGFSSQAFLIDLVFILLLLYLWFFCNLYCFIFYAYFFRCEDELTNLLLSLPIEYFSLIPLVRLLAVTSNFFNHIKVILSGNSL